MKRNSQTLFARRLPHYLITSLLHPPLFYGLTIAVLFLSLYSAILLSPAYGETAKANTSSQISAQDAKQVLEILNNPKKREEYTKFLNIIAKTPQSTNAAQTTPAKTDQPAPTEKKITLEPDGLGSAFLSQFSNIGTFLSKQIQTFTGLFHDLIFVGSWFKAQIDNPEARHNLIDIFTRSGLIFIVALAVEHFLFLFIRKPITHIAERASFKEISTSPPPPAPDKKEESLTAPLQTPEIRKEDVRKQHEIMRIFRRIPYALGRFILKLLPLVCFVLLGYAGALLLTRTGQGKHVVVLLVNSYAIARSIYLIVEVIFTPKLASIRLGSASDETARRVMKWWGMLVAAPAIVICLSQLGASFHLSPRGTNALIRIVVLIEHLLLAGFIWRLRGPVSNMLQPPKRFKNKSFWAFIGRLVRYWWVPAIIFDMSLWFTWVTKSRNGYKYMWQATLISFAIILAARILTVLLLGRMDRFFQVSPALEEKIPNLQHRINRYYPIIRKILTWAVILITIMCIGQVWGISTLTFLTKSTFGHELLYSIGIIAIVTLIGIFIWEGVNALIEKKIMHTTTPEEEARAIRLRTLLPILRTILFSVLVTLLALVVLSQLGINVTPLLAGASILGVAISFGSQKLVQDFITGFFLLAENAIQVGDSITAAGVSGTVEHLSIRTLRLRAGDGSLQIIPFSSVGSVINQSRDYSVAVISLTVDMTESPEKVSQLMLQTGEELKNDTAVKDLLLADFVLNGVDTIDDHSLTITGSVRCIANNRSAVIRAFNRILHKKLEDAHIRMPRVVHALTTLPKQNFSVDLKGASSLTVPQKDNINE